MEEEATAEGHRWLLDGEKVKETNSSLNQQMGDLDVSPSRLILDF
jgi:hypothetical protein